MKPTFHTVPVLRAKLAYHHNKASDLVSMLNARKYFVLKRKGHTMRINSISPYYRTIVTMLCDTAQTHIACKLFIEAALRGEDIPAEIKDKI